MEPAWLWPGSRSSRKIFLKMTKQNKTHPTTPQGQIRSTVSPSVVLVSEASEEGWGASLSDGQKAQRASSCHLLAHCSAQHTSLLTEPGHIFKLIRLALQWGTSKQVQKKKLILIFNQNPCFQSFVRYSFLERKKSFNERVFFPNPTQRGKVLHPCNENRYY